jgi:hypothetical protein
MLTRSLYRGEIVWNRSRKRNVWERRELLLSWLPSCEGFVLPGATHLLHVQNPLAMAEALVSFFARHPMRVR